MLIEQDWNEEFFTLEYKKIIEQAFTKSGKIFLYIKTRKIRQNTYSKFI